MSNSLPPAESAHPLSAIPASAVSESGRPVENSVSQESLSKTHGSHLALALESLIDNSASATTTNKDVDVSQGVDMHAPHMFKAPWIGKLMPELERLASRYHVGNFVIVRGTGEKIFESMPIYARIGMHLLFYGRLEELLMSTESVDSLLQRLSIKQGILYDSPKSAESIPSFIKLYSLPLAELLEPDISKYATFNDFFSRKLASTARPVQNLADPTGICSAADCRLVVYPSFSLAQEFWVKGRHFNAPALLGVGAASETAAQFDEASVAIFRLAPQDYHRFHCPIDGSVDGPPTLIHGQYYTVNPQAVNQPDFDVLTANVRSILYMTHGPTGKKVAFVAIGALLVGSIEWTFADLADGTSVVQGLEVKRGEELGCFKYGGSTVVVLFEKGILEFDADLVKNSSETLETLVQVGESIGTSVK